jgi:hypothetical protein
LQREESISSWTKLLKHVPERGLIVPAQDEHAGAAEPDNSEAVIRQKVDVRNEPEHREESHTPHVCHVVATDEEGHVARAIVATIKRKALYLRIPEDVWRGEGRRDAGGWHCLLLGSVIATLK